MRSTGLHQVARGGSTLSSTHGNPQLAYGRLQSPIGGVPPADLGDGRATRGIVWQLRTSAVIAADVTMVGFFEVARNRVVHGSNRASRRLAELRASPQLRIMAQSLVTIPACAAPPTAGLVIIRCRSPERERMTPPHRNKGEFRQGSGEGASKRWR
jgi:hypothetical protein